MDSSAEPLRKSLIKRDSIKQIIKSNLYFEVHCYVYRKIFISGLLIISSCQFNYFSFLLKNWYHIFSFFYIFYFHILSYSTLLKGSYFLE